MPMKFAHPHYALMTNEIDRYGKKIWKLTPMYPDDPSKILEVPSGSILW